VAGINACPTRTKLRHYPLAVVDPGGLSALPGRIKPDGRRWLPKTHGCLSDPDRVVLTRASDTRYDERLPGLAGLVQAFLVTRHVRFAGFSLTDDNFHRIVDAIRRLRDAGRPPGPPGTALALGSGGLAEVFWEGDVHRVRMADAGEAGDGFPAPAAARTPEVFLDFLASRTRGRRTCSWATASARSSPRARSG
jgi:hypothetical protein